MIAFHESDKVQDYISIALIIFILLYTVHYIGGLSSLTLTALESDTMVKSRPVGICTDRHRLLESPPSPHISREFHFPRSNGEVCKLAFLNQVSNARSITDSRGK